MLTLASNSPDLNFSRVGPFENMVPLGMLLLVRSKNSLVQVLGAASQDVKRRGGERISDIIRGVVYVHN